MEEHTFDVETMQKAIMKSRWGCARSTLLFLLHRPSGSAPATLPARPGTSGCAAPPCKVSAHLRHVQGTGGDQCLLSDQDLLSTPPPSHRVLPVRSPSPARALQAGRSHPVSQGGDFIWASRLAGRKVLTPSSTKTERFPPVPSRCASSVIACFMSTVRGTMLSVSLLQNSSKSKWIL